ncbi:hypothetical protein ES702_01478 [subsurface metagenome]
MQYFMLRPRESNSHIQMSGCAGTYTPEANVYCSEQIRLQSSWLFHPFTAIRLIGTGGGAIQPNFFSSSTEGRLPYTEYTL